MVNPKVLVAYATRFGTTREVAEAIGQSLRDAGADVDVELVDDVQDPTGYRAVVVGSPVNGGVWLAPAIDFVRRFQESLRSRPTAFFAVGALLNKPNPKYKNAVLATLSELPAVNLVDVGMFAGSVAHLSLPLRIMMRLTMGAKGDMRDWDAIEAWALSLAPKLGVG